MSEEDDDDDYVEYSVAMTNDADADTALIVQMAALMLTGEGEDAYLCAMDTPLYAVGTSLCMAASMIAHMAEHLAEQEGCSPEQILLELRNWMNDPGESNG